MLFVNATYSKIENGSGHVAIENDRERELNIAIEELSDMKARHLALEWAGQNGVPAARQNGNVIGPYAVNSEGLPLDAVKDENGDPLPATHERMRPHRFRVTVNVCPPVM